LVADAWKRFDRELIAPSKVLHPNKAPTVGFQPSELGDIIMGSCVVPPKPAKT
jgi:hypothetical protein